MAAKGKGPGWLAVILLAPLGAIGAAAGQAGFDLLNHALDGRAGGVIVSMLIKPLAGLARIPATNDWALLGIALFLPRWVFGAGAVALACGLALRYPARKTVIVSAIGCAIGAVCWLAASCALLALPPGWHRPYLPPAVLNIVLPSVMIAFLLCLALREARPLLLRFLLGGLIAGIAGVLLSHVPLEHFMARAARHARFSAFGLSSIRIAEAFLTVFALGVVTLVLLRRPASGRGSR